MVPGQAASVTESMKTVCRKPVRRVVLEKAAAVGSHRRLQSVVNYPSRFLNIQRHQRTVIIVIHKLYANLFFVYLKFLYVYSF